MLSINEKKLIEYLEKIENKLRFSFYSILNLMSIKFEYFKENYNLYKYNISPKKDNVNEININKIISNFENNKNNHIKELEAFNNHLIKFEDLYNQKMNEYVIIFKNLDEIYKYFDSLKKKYLLSFTNHELLNRTDLFKIMMKDIINSKEDDQLIRNILINERFRGSILKSTYQAKKDKLKLNQLKGLLTKSIKEIFYELKIKKVNKTLIFKNIAINKYLKIEIKYIENQLLFNIILPIFNILFELPFNKAYNLKNFLFILSISGKEENDYKSNHRKFYSDKKKKKKLLLYKKIEELFKIRIYSIADIIIKEKRMENNNINFNVVCTNEFLIDILQKFIDYISDYYKLFKI